MVNIIINSKAAVMLQH